MLKSMFIYKCHYAQVNVYILMSLCSNQGLYINVIMLKSMFYILMSLCSSQCLYINVIMLKSRFIYKCHYAQVNVYIYKCHYAQVNVYI